MCWSFPPLLACVCIVISVLPIVLAFGTTESVMEGIRVPKIKAILFDLDGTLLDTETISDQALLAALELTDDRKRLPWELKKQILGLRGAEWGPIVLRYVQENWGVTDLPTVDELWSSWEDHVSQMCHQVEACAGAPELVQQLAVAGIPMAIATSSRQASVDKKRKNHGKMFQHLPTIVCGDHPAVKNGKPAPDIYLEAARQLGVDPKECLVVEDALSGVQSGKNAGCFVVAVPDARFDADEKAVFAAEAHAVLDSLWHFPGEQFGIRVEMKSP